MQQFDQKADDKPVTINRQKYDKFLSQATPYIDGIPSFEVSGCRSPCCMAVCRSRVGVTVEFTLSSFCISSSPGLLASLCWGCLVRRGVSDVDARDDAVDSLFVASVGFNFHVPFAPTAILVLWMIFVFRDLPDLHHTVHAVGKKKRGRKSGPSIEKAGTKAYDSALCAFFLPCPAELIRALSHTYLLGRGTILSVYASLYGATLLRRRWLRFCPANAATHKRHPEPKQSQRI